MKIPINTQRAIVRHLCEHGLSNRRTASLVGVSHNTVRVVRDQLALTGESWTTLAPLNDVDFLRQLGTESSAATQRKATPDWPQVHAELQKRDVTLELLWQEFREGEPHGVSYPQMTRLYREWTRTLRLSMRQLHKAGDKLFVDFCGRTMPIVDRDTGEVSHAQVFVGVLGASGYIYARAVASQKIGDWLACHADAFAHLGGVVNFVVPDNLKSAVTKNTRKELILNTAYAEFAEHYGFAILPARPRKPRDKGLAEVSVQIVQRGVLARLRHRTFFSLDELNAEIMRLLAAINEKTSRKSPTSRTARFLDLDAPALRPLPATRYEYWQWRYEVRVPDNYLVEHDEHFYAVPYQYAHHLVDIRVDRQCIEILHQRQRIARHLLSRKAGGVTCPESFMAPHHRHQLDAEPDALQAWADAVGAQTGEFVRRNLAVRRDFANRLKSMRALRRWVREERLEGRIESACDYALQLGTTALARLQNIVRHDSDHRAAIRPERPWVTDHNNLRGADYYATAGASTC